jgi:hypothetical protein
MDLARLTAARRNRTRAKFALLQRAPITSRWTGRVIGTAATPGAPLPPLPPLPPLLLLPSPVTSPSGNPQEPIMMTQG